MKKQYVFLIMILIILYISYLIITFTYKEYQINSKIEYIGNLITELNIDIKESKSVIKYQTSKSFVNKILKEQQSFKNKGEKVVYFTSEDKYNKYTKNIEETLEPIEEINEKHLDIQEMSIYEKWLYFLFKKK